MKTDREELQGKRIDPAIYTTGKLKPCPFCARENMDIIKYSDKCYSIACKCGLEAPGDSKSIAGIIRIWNRRRFLLKVALEAMEKALAELRKKTK